jgi:hypothetical protein
MSSCRSQNQFTGSNCLGSARINIEHNNEDTSAILIFISTRSRLLAIALSRLLCWIIVQYILPASFKRGPS